MKKNYTPDPAATKTGIVFGVNHQPRQLTRSEELLQAALLSPRAKRTRCALIRILRNLIP